MNKTNQKLLALLCAVLLLTLPGISVLAAEPAQTEPAASESTVFPFTEVPIYADEEFVGTGMMVNSVTYVPLLNFVELILQTACEVCWEQETGTATLTAEGFSAELSVDSRYMTVNGRYLYFRDGVYNLNGTIVVPIRELAKVFGMETAWDSTDFVIHLDTSEAALFDSGDAFYNEEDLYWLSHVIYSEAGNQPLEGKLGVGNVVLNRLHDDSGAFRDTVRGVIFQYGQFDVVASGGIYMEPNEESVVAAKLCLEGYNTVGDAKFFVNPEIGSTTWFKTHRTFLLTIQDHDFYA